MTRLRNLTRPAARVAAILAVALAAPAAVASASVLTPVAAPLPTPPDSFLFGSAGGSVFALYTFDGPDELYRVAADGTFTPLAALPAGTSSGQTSEPIPVVSPDATRIAMIDLGAHTILGNTLSGATIIPAGTAQPTAGGLPAVSPDGDLIAVPNLNDGTVDVLAVGTDGALTSAPGSPFAATLPGEVAFSADGRHLYVVDGRDATITTYAVAPDGSLSQTGAPVSTDGSPVQPAVSPDGRFLAVGTDVGVTDLFSIAADGTPTAMAPIPTDNQARARVSFSPAADVLAVVANMGASSVSLYHVTDTGATLIDAPIHYPGAPTAALFTNHGANLAVGERVQQSGGNGSPLVSTGTDQLDDYAVAQPAAAITGLDDGASVVQGTSVPVSFSCTDAAVAIAGCTDSTGDSAGGSGGQATLDTTGLGPHTYAVTATDALGQRSVRTLRYTVTAAAPPPATAAPAAAAPVLAPAAPVARLALLRAVRGARGTVVIWVRAPGAGRLDVLATAWDDNFSHGAHGTLQPAARRFAFARGGRSVARATTIRYVLRPGVAGRRLLARLRYRVTVRVWVRFTGSGTSDSSGIRHLVLTRRGR